MHPYVGHFELPRTSTCTASRERTTAHEARHASLRTLLPSVSRNRTIPYALRLLATCSHQRGRSTTHRLLHAVSPTRSLPHAQRCLHTGATPLDLAAFHRRPGPRSGTRSRQHALTSRFSCKCASASTPHQACDLPAAIARLLRPRSANTHPLYRYVTTQHGLPPPVTTGRPTAPQRERSSSRPHQLDPVRALSSTP
jgi:hypothetical protein